MGTMGYETEMAGFIIPVMMGPKATDWWGMPSSVCALGFTVLPPSPFPGLEEKQGDGA